MRKPRKPLHTEQPKSLAARAKGKMDLWRKGLRHKDRAKLRMHASPWGRHGGSMIVPKRRHTNAFKRREKLKYEREARLRAEQAAYEERRILQSPIGNERNR